MEIKSNYEEKCTCGCSDIKTERVWRILTWKCSKCGKNLASTTVSDSPVAMFYAHKALFIRCNDNLRKEKGLEPKKTIITFYDDDGNRILWRDIVKKNEAWEKSVGEHIQRKSF